MKFLPSEESRSIIYDDFIWKLDDDPLSLNNPTPLPYGFQAYSMNSLKEYMFHVHVA